MSLKYRDANGVEQGIAGTPYDVIKSIKDIQENNGAKNLIPYPWEQPEDDSSSSAKGSIDWTDNGDGSFTLTGDRSLATGDTSIRFKDRKKDFILPKGKYILTGCPEGGYYDPDTLSNSKYYCWIILYYKNPSGSADISEIYYDEGNGIIFEVKDNLKYIRGGTGYWLKESNIDITFKPMIRHIEDMDDTFESYGATNQDLSKNKMDWEANKMLGARNMVKPWYNYPGDTYTHNGITYTVNSNMSISATGVNSSSSAAIFSFGRVNLKPGTYILSGVAGGNPHTYYVQLYKGSSPAIDKKAGEVPKIFRVTETINNVEVRMIAENGVDISSGVTYYPLVRIANDPETEYTRCSMTNPEITDVLGNVIGFDPKIRMAYLTTNANRIIIPGFKKIFSGYRNIIQCVYANQNGSGAVFYIWTGQSTGWDATLRFYSSDMSTQLTNATYEYDGNNIIINGITGGGNWGRGFAIGLFTEG